jgi:hypothetical protein
MTRQLIKGMTMLLLVVALALVSAVASAHAQSNTTAVADIPFEFVAGGKSLAAGHYTLSAATAGGQVVSIRGAEQMVMTLTNGITNRAPQDKGRLVFRRYGNKYFLAEIWKPGESSGRELMKSKEEKATQRELASIRAKTKSGGTNYELVEIALVKE